MILFTLPFPKRDVYIVRHQSIIFYIFFTVASDAAHTSALFTFFLAYHFEQQWSLIHNTELNCIIMSKR